MRFVWLLAVLALAWACGSRTPPPVAGAEPPSPPAASSPAAVPPVAAPAVVAGPTEPHRPDTCSVRREGLPVVTIGLGDALEPANAPVPSNPSERLVFRQLYETLLRIDCEGEIRPGLASSWRFDPALATWIVTLREDARFTDGSPATAAEVLAAWQGDGAMVPRVSRHLRSALARDARTLELVAHGEAGGSPDILAHTDLAVARRSVTEVWPHGTRGMVVEAFAPAPPAPTQTITLTAVRSSADGNRASIRFVSAPTRDVRDLLDRPDLNVDLLLTRDSAALQYAAALPVFETVPLPWNRTYVLVSRWRGEGAAEPSVDDRRALAVDAVRGEARPADGPFWWQGAAACSSAPALPVPAASSDRVVYDAGDEVGRDVAQRLVALRGSERGRLVVEALLTAPAAGRLRRAAALSSAGFAAAAAAGADAAYIVDVDRAPIDRCGGWRDLQRRFPWVYPAAVVSLVETRAHAVLRRGRSGLVLEHDGALIAGPPMQPGANP